MNASKENARKANVYLDHIVGTNTLAQSVVPEVAFIHDFLKAAIAKLPSEAAYEKAKLRRIIKSK